MRNNFLTWKSWIKQFVLLLFILNRNSMAFYCMHVRPQILSGLRRTPATSPPTLWGSMEDFDDMPSSIGDAVSSDGEALAKEFYQQIRQREEGGGEKEGGGSFTRNRRATKGKVVVPLDSPTTVPRKYVGQNSNKNPNEPSAGLFTGRGVSVYSVPRATPRQRMMENELKLVGRNEQTLLIQIGVTLALLTFALYIGITGGITSNDWSTVPDNIDTSMEGIEGLLPVPTDTEVSLWL